MTLRAERGAEKPLVQEFEIIHRDQPFGSMAGGVLFIVNVLMSILLIVLVGSILLNGGGSPGAKLLASSSIIASLFTVWAAIAVVLGITRYFNRRTFIRVPGKE